MSHARHVSRLSLQLFDATQDLHGCSRRDRALLNAMALLHNVGLADDEVRHHLVGRDIVLATPIRGYSERERTQIACGVAFHRKSVSAQLDPAFNALDAQAQRTTLVLSALLRIADGCDYSGLQRTFIDKIQSNASRLRIRLRGQDSHQDAARAIEKADLWRELFGETQIDGRLESAGLNRDMPLAYAARRIMRYHMDQAPQRALAPGAALGEAPPGRVKKLRVAVRRLRLDLRMFEPALKAKTTRQIGKGLKRLSAGLGAAREADMLAEAAGDYQRACDEEARAGIQPLVDALQAHAAQARAALTELLADDDYPAWRAAFDAFLNDNAPDAYARLPDVGEPSHLRHAADASLWQHIAAVRAFDVLGDEPDYVDLHALRVAIKRLRYLLDAFDGLLPRTAAKRWREGCAAAQAELGAINDAHVAAASAAAFAAEHRADARAVLRYAEAQQRIADERRRSWRAVLKPFL
jgi:CHAD domain-containing protein